jgi:hypothetical protein
MTTRSQSDAEADQEFSARYAGTPATVYQCCRQAARHQTTMTYDEVNQTCGLGLDFRDPSHRNKISNILGDVSEFEVRKGRPMLSAVVVLSGSHPISPGQGFFDWAGKLGVRRGPREDNQLFFARILKEVFDYWKQR